MPTPSPVINTPFWADKSLWVALLGFLLPIVNSKLGLGLEPEVVYGALSPLLLFIASSKWKSAMLTKEIIRAEAAKTGAAEASKPDATETALNQ
jgi:hypothetical protein